MHSLRSLVMLTVAITLVGVICLVATFSHAASNPLWPVVMATAATCSGVVPPLWIAARIKDGPSKQLAIIGSRLLIMLPTIMLSGLWHGAERKCFLTTLLACYFIALPLESWLLIREVRRSGK